MRKRNDEFNDRINKFYTYLEERLENQDELEKQIKLDETCKSDKIIIKRERQPIPSTI